MTFSNDAVQQDKGYEGMDSAPIKFADTQIEGTWQKWWFLFILWAMTGLIYADPRLLAPNLSDAAADFKMSDTDRDLYLGGYLQAALFIIGGGTALIIGHMADQLNKRILYACIVLVGQAGCAMMLLVTEFWQLFLTTSMMGMAIGGAAPCAFAILGEIFPGDERMVVVGAFKLGMGAGGFSGQYMAGYVGEEWGWRAPFAVAAIPTSLLAVVFLLLTRQPRHKNEKEPEVLPLGLKIGTILQTRTNPLGFAQGLAGCVPWSIFSFLNDYLYVDRKSLSKMEATVVCSLFTAGVTAGSLIGGYLGQFLYRKNKKFICYLMGFTTILGILPLLLIIRVDFSYPVASVISFAGGIIASITGTNITTVILNVNYVNLRGFVLAMFTLTDDIGRSLGGLGISGLIYTLGREEAFTLATAIGWTLCGIILASMAFTMTKDEAATAGNVPFQAPGNEHKSNLEFVSSVNSNENVKELELCYTGTESTVDTPVRKRSTAKLHEV